MGNINAAQHQRTSRNKAVSIVTVTDSHYILTQIPASLGTDLKSVPGP